MDDHHLSYIMENEKKKKCCNILLRIGSKEMRRYLLPHVLGLC
jgi:hypothetical protein